MFISCTLNFMYIVGKAIHELKIPTKYLKGNCCFSKVHDFKVIMNLSVIFKLQDFVPMNINDFTVFISLRVNYFSTIAIWAIQIFFSIA